MKIEIEFDVDEYIELRCCIRQKVNDLEQHCKKFPNEYFANRIKELNSILEKTHRDKVIK